MLSDLTQKIEKWGTIQFIFLFTALGELFTAFMNAVLSKIFWEEISFDLLTIGSIDAFVVSIIVSSIGIYFIRKNAALNNEIEASKRVEVALQQKAAVLDKNNKELQSALARIRTLSEMLPICSYCKKIRDDKGYWEGVETYISEHTNTVFTHGMCPECAETLLKEMEE
jgi:hypothetical protein